MLRYLIQECGVTVICLEANFAITRPLNAYVLTGEGDAVAALIQTGFWSIANEETTAFVKWLAGYNRSERDPSTRVKIVGCDIQSLDDGKTEINYLLRVFLDQRIVTKQDCSDIGSRLAKLPEDR